ncbi:MAG: hypothetical protein HDS84_07160 [Bacteroidales bacterium]|nr:hypothetical protein [Bacteroidales bacterium]
MFSRYVGKLSGPLLGKCRDMACYVWVYTPANYLSHYSASVGTWRAMSG